MAEKEATRGKSEKKLVMVCGGVRWRGNPPGVLSGLAADCWCWHAWHSAAGLLGHGAMAQSSSISRQQRMAWAWAAVRSTCSRAQQGRGDMIRYLQGECGLEPTKVVKSAREQPRSSISQSHSLRYATSISSVGAGRELLRQKGQGKGSKSKSTVQGKGKRQHKS